MRSRRLSKNGRKDGKSALPVEGTILKGTALKMLYHKQQSCYSKSSVSFSTHLICMERVGFKAGATRTPNVRSNVEFNVQTTAVSWQPLNGKQNSNATGTVMPFIIVTTVGMLKCLFNVPLISTILILNGQMHLRSFTTRHIKRSTPLMLVLSR